MYKLLQRKQIYCKLYKLQTPRSTAVKLCGESVLSLFRDGWLVAWGFCGFMLIRFSTVWLLPFTLL